MTGSPDAAGARHGSAAPAWGALIGWLIAAPLSLLLALSDGQPRGERLARHVAESSRFQLELATGIGTVAGMALVAGVVQLCGSGIGLVVGRWIARRRRGDGTRADPRQDPARLRQSLTVGLYWSLHTFPASALYVVGLPVFRSWGNALARTRPTVAAIGRGAYYLGVLLFQIGLTHWAPFLTTADQWFFGLFGALLWLALRRWPERRQAVLLLSAGVLLARFAAWPPQRPGFPLTFVTAMASAAMIGLPAWIAGAEGCRSLGTLGPTLSVLAVAFWTWCGIFLLYPSPGLAGRIASAPGVRVLYRNGSGATWNDNRFLTEACREGRLLYGSRERPFGVIELGVHGPGTSLFVHTGYNLVLDCERAIGYVGSYSGREIARIGLEPLRVMDPVPSVSIDAPTLLQLSPGKRWLYAIDDRDGTFHRVDLRDGGITGNLSECLPNGLFVDETHGRVFLPTCGHLDIYDLAVLDQSLVAQPPPLARVDLKRGFRPPFPLGPHFHRVTGDPESGMAWISYLETGRVYRVNGIAGTLENEAYVGRGIRDLTFDPRNHLVWVGNYVTGELLALDPTTLAIVGRVLVGTRIRSIEVSMDGTRVLTTSSTGAISVDVSALPEARRGPRVDARQGAAVSPRT